MKLGRADSAPVNVIVLSTAMTLPAGFAAQLAHLTSVPGARTASLASVKAPCSVPVERSVQLIANSAGPSAAIAFETTMLDA